VTRLALALRRGAAAAWSRSWRCVRGRSARPSLRALAIAAFVLALPPLTLALAVAATPLPRELRDARPANSWRVTDRDGRLLREVRAGDGARARWITLEECGDLLPQVLVAVEDRRFYAHRGVDLRAVVRALASDLRAGRVVSGASTLTMQLARTLRPHARGLAGKLYEIALALRIEASLSKREILEQYLNRVTFGPNLRGIAATSQAYFDEPPSRLSPAEAALLVGLARGPSYYELTRHLDRAVRRRDRLLARLLDAGVLTPAAYETALAEPIALQRSAPAFGAPHFVGAVARGALGGDQPGLAEALRGPVASIETTIDGAIQAAAEAAAARVPVDLAAKHVTAASVVVVDNGTGDILAYVGSPDVLDDAHAGQNDGVRALRQPGSTLKPFLYGLAIERLGWTGATVLPDVELHVATAAGDYVPRDYDEHYRGPVRLREALGNSLNVPAVWTAEQVGVPALLDRLRAVGFASLAQPPEYYGPGLALGDGEVTLLELVRAYAVLARSGWTRPLRVVRRLADGSGRWTDFAPEGGEPVLPAQAVAEVTDVLRDRDARRGSFGERTVLDFDYDVAAKTGTSKGYRDNWVVGFTHKVTVGVWVGNFDGSSMRGTSGISGAGPLFHAVMDAAMRGRPAASLAVAAHPANAGLQRVEVCALSGEAPGPGCTHRIAEWMPPGAAESLPTCSMHERIRIDRRNGLRAGPACGADVAEERDFERYPPEYLTWAARAGRPVAPPLGSPFCAPIDTPSGAGANLRIANVEDGARFAIDPDRPRSLQTLEVQVAVSQHVGRVRLRVDGAVVGSEAAPYRFEWPLVPGEHVLVAEADGVPPSAPARLRVRGL
jgi:penicillin-binding protein 1C